MAEAPPVGDMIMADGVIGKHCWVYKHWRRKGWRSGDYCPFYPTYRERSILKGENCSYFEPRKSYRKMNG